MQRLDPQEMRRLELNSEELGVPVAKLMARAGKAVASEVLRRLGRGGVAWFLCGKGNNGGDGFAAASLVLKQGHRARVVLAEPPAKVRGAAARAYLQALPEDVVSVWSRAPPAAASGDVVADCLLGSGVKGPPRPPYDAALRWIGRQREAGRPVVACDMPSALGHRLAVRPTVTVTFHAAKEGMRQRDCGRIKLVDIGIPPVARDRAGIGDLAVAFRPPGRDSHKGDNGRVLVVAGGPFTGAAWYSAMAAARTGADLVHVATPAEAARTIAAWGPTPLVHATEPGDRLTAASLPDVLPLLERVDAVVVGPGLGSHPETREAAGAVIDEAARRGLGTVVDADGLDALDAKRMRGHPCLVLTPHSKEFEDLAGKEAKDPAVVAFARQNRVVVLRKGPVDLVTDGAATRRCHRGHPAMTVGGTGDVLTGAVATLLALGAAPLDAASGAAYLVGCAGELAASILGPGMQATDVHEAIPSVLQRLP